MVSSNEMTHQPQDDFESCMEHAEAWMKAIQERLRISDNTQGPRSALEARLRETEIICEQEPEGRFKMDMVLMKAEALLQESGEDEKHEIQAKLKDIKSMFEETTTYMTHCHSRIEWVWLHWSEYLKARDEFTLWIHNMRLTLEPDVELQLGLKEKQWQYSHAQVLLKDVQNQATLLDRLLEEAAALYNRIGDPSVDEDVQNQMRGEYEGIKKKAQERVELLQRIMADHSEYEENVHQFREWLNDVIEKLKGCVGTMSASTQSKLQTFQDIANDVKFGQQKLEELQVQSVSIIVSTSPLGAENIKAEQEELRNALAQLKLMNEEEMESLMKAHQSESSFQEISKDIEDEIQEFRKVIQTLESNLGTEEKVKNEDQLIALWNQRVATRLALAKEEPREEKLKLLLRELFTFSHDVQDPSNSVMAVIREYRSVTNKAFKLCTESDSELRQCFQNPLREFHHWKSAIQRVLEATEDITDLPMIQDFSLQIEMLVKESSRLKDRLMMVQLNKDILSSVFGDQKAETLLNKVVHAAKEREALHNSLLQRTLSFQTSASQSEDFDAAFEALKNSLQTIGSKVAAENEPQPDLVGKETQLQRLQMLHEELLKLVPQFEELETNDQLSPGQKYKMNQLASKRLAVYRSLETMFKNSKQYINDHRRLNNNLLDLQRWVMETRQELESYQDVNQEQNLDNEERHTESLFAEFPEKEMQLHQVETQGQRVMENSSPDGASHIQSELEQLKTSWEYLLQLLKALTQLHPKNQFSEMEMDAGKKTTIEGHKRMFRSHSYSADDITVFGKMPDEQNEHGMEITSSGEEMDISGSESDVGLRQSTFGIAPQPVQERTSHGRIRGAEGMQQDIAITSSPEDEFTASGSKASEYEYECTSELPSDAEAATTNMDRSRSQQAHGFNSSSVGELTDLGEDRDADRDEWTFSKHTHFRDDMSTPRMSVPGAGYQWTIKPHSEAEGSGNKMALGGSQQLTWLNTIPEDEISSSSNKMSASGSGWTIGLPSTEEPGTKNSAVRHKRTIGEPSDSGASGDKMAAGGQKWTIGITPDAKAFGSKMPPDASQQRSALSTSTMDGTNMPSAESAKTIELHSEAEPPTTNVFSAGHKWTIESNSEAAAFGEEISEAGHGSTMGLPSVTDTSGKKMSAAGPKWANELPSEADVSEGKMPAAGHKWAIGLPSEAGVPQGKMAAARHKWTVGSYSEGEASGENMSGHTSTIQLTPEADANRKKKSSAEHKWTVRSSSEAEASGNKLAGGESKQLTGLSTSSVDEMTTSGKKMSASGNERVIGLPSEAGVSDGKVAAAGHKWAIGSYSEGEASEELKAGGEHQQSSGIRFSSVHEIAGEGMDAEGNKLTTGVPYHLNDKMTANGENTEAVGSDQTPGLYFFPEDEMTALVERMGKAGRKPAGLSLHADGDNLSAGKKRSVVGGKQISGVTSHSGHEITAPGGNMSAEGSEWTVKFPSRPAKGMSEFSGQIKGAEKMRFPEIKDSAEYSRLMKEFEEWLRVENSKLNKIRLTKTSNSDEDIEMRRKTLLMLKSRVPGGQRLFETLRHYRPAMGVTEDLQMEDLRYRWMLYKSKLKDSDNISSLEDLEEPVRLQKKPPGMCAFLHRVCCAALPLQLLLLLLLLLAFLLPLAEENHSCTLANNFARSFSLMLRYDKPPPT